MTTTSPSWFPAWPADWRDLEADYLETVPRQYPAGLYEEGTDERRDLDAVAIALSWIAQGGEWVRRRVFPQFDDDAMFLHLWEEAIALPRRATTALRQAAIIARVRMIHGGRSRAMIQRVMAPIFGEDDPASILFSYASFADVVAAAPDSEEAWAEALNTLHIYSGTGSTPDWPSFWDAVAALKPTWQRWSGGAAQYMRWDTDDAGWDRGCWDA